LTWHYFTRKKTNNTGIDYNFAHRKYEDINITQQFKCKWSLNHVDLNFNCHSMSVRFMEACSVDTRTNCAFLQHALPWNWTQWSHLSHCAQPAYFRDAISSRYCFPVGVWFLGDVWLPFVLCARTISIISDLHHFFFSLRIFSTTSGPVFIALSFSVGLISKAFTRMELFWCQNIRDHLISWVFYAWNMRNMFVDIWICGFFQLFITLLKCRNILWGS